MTLTVGSLFSGIGGLDLGLERAGMNVIWQSEIDPYASKVLAKHWPKVPNYGDIKAINWGDIVRPDIICGGYPCQPFSVAGRRDGANDPRHLWPWVYEAIGYLRPRYAVMENVRGHLTMGFDRVLADLASIGYDSEWRTIRASDVGAHHKRERIIIVAYPDQRNVECSIDSAISQGTTKQRREVFTPLTTSGSQGGTTGFTRFPQPGMVRVANGIPNRVDRLKGLGNAVVPQVAELVGRMVMAHANA